MVTSPDQKGVIGSMGNILVELRSGATNWKILSQSLKYGRKMPVIVAIPNDLTTCGKLKSNINKGGIISVGIYSNLVLFSKNVLNLCTSTFQCKLKDCGTVHDFLHILIDRKIENAF
jgi:hypothetical protein